MKVLRQRMILHEIGGYFLNSFSRRRSHPLVLGNGRAACQQREGYDPHKGDTAETSIHNAPFVPFDVSPGLILANCEPT